MRSREWVVLLILVMFVAFTGAANSIRPAVKVLFDNAHAETAGNADWTIYGAYSDFADRLRSVGFIVESHEKSDGLLTYELLKNYKVLVLPEPNSPFKDAEVDAILKFIENGGGVFLIGDHTGSDRNHDGWDSPKIFNVFAPKLGFYFAKKWVSQAPVAGGRVEGFITRGVYRVGAWGATWLEIKDSKRVKAWIFFKFKKQGKKPYVITGTYGKGRFAAIGDSSPFDDGTGAPGNHLHDGWQTYDHPQLAENVVRWLAGEDDPKGNVEKIMNMLSE